MPARICICDDDPVVAELLQTELAAAGFDVQEPLCGVEQAMGWLALDPPDVLILDLNMPVGGGLDLLGWLGARGLLDRTRVLMLTGEADTFYIDRARRLGASGYLTKPVAPGSVTAKVRRLLGDPGVRWIDDFTTLSTAGPAAAPASVRAAAPARARLLSVEDVACTQQLVGLFLNGCGYTVDQASSGAEALSLAAAHRYDLILTDLRLPDIDGLEVVRRIRRSEGPRRAAIVALSADALPEHVRTARLAGVDAHLAKPFTSAALRAVVEAHLPVVAPTVETLNPVVAEMARTYGEPAVRSLLQSLLTQLDRFPQAPAPAADDMAHRAHAAKGAAASMGFEAIASACGELERSCREGAAFDQPFRRAAEACDRVRRDIAACLKHAA